MTKEEMKRELIEILQAIDLEDDEGYSHRLEDWEADIIASALISEGIGDVDDFEVKCEVLQRDVDNLTRTLEEGREELEEANRRAEVAEQALLIASKRALQLSHKAKVAERALQIAEELGELCAPAQNYIDRAKKELAKENKQC